MTLITPVQSGKGELYAKAGATVTIIRISEPAVIVEANGIRFTTVKDNIKWE